jgi:hypothetical protein
MDALSIPFLRTQGEHFVGIYCAIRICQSRWAHFKYLQVPLFQRNAFIRSLEPRIWEYLFPLQHKNGFDQSSHTTGTLLFMKISKLVYQFWEVYGVRALTREPCILSSCILRDKRTKYVLVQSIMNVLGVDYLENILPCEFRSEESQTYKVADVGLDSANMDRIASIFAEVHEQCRSFDRITSLGSSSMRLYVRCFQRIQTGLSIDLTCQCFLGFGAREGDTWCFAIVINPGIPYDGPDYVSILQSLVDWLENHTSNTLSTAITVSPLIKAVASTIRRQKPGCNKSQ